MLYKIINSRVLIYPIIRVVNNALTTNNINKLYRGKTKTTDYHGLNEPITKWKI